MSDPCGVRLCDAIEAYLDRHAFGLTDRLEVFGSTSSKDNPLIGGQLVRVRGNDVKFDGMGFCRLVEWKLTAEKRGGGWNIVCSPGVVSSNVAKPSGPAAARAATTDPPPLVC